MSVCVCRNGVKLEMSTGLGLEKKNIHKVKKFRKSQRETNTAAQNHGENPWHA